MRSFGGELGDLLRSTLDHPAVSSSRLQAEAANLQTEAAKGRLYGQAALSYGLSRYEGPRVVGYYAPGTLPAPLIDRNIGVASVSYSLPIDIFGQISAAADKARNQAATADLLYRQKQLGKLHQTLGAYYTLYALQCRQEALIAYRGAVEAMVKRLKAEVALGRSAPVQTSYAESQLARLQSDETQVHGDIVAMQASLAEASGTPDVIAGSRSVFIPDWSGASGRDALSVKIAKTGEKAALAAVNEARTNLMPQVSLNTNFARNDAIDGGSRDTWSVGVNISVPIGVSSYRQLGAARAAAFAAQDAALASQREADAAIAALSAQYDTAKSEIVALEKEVAYRNELVKVEKEMHTLGNQTMENLFRHEDDLLEAKTRLAQAQVKAVASWSGMQMLIGIEPETYIKALDGTSAERK